MSAAIRMPALSAKMEKRSIARRLVSIGHQAKTGDLIAEIEAVEVSTVVELVFSAGTG